MYRTASGGSMNRTRAGDRTSRILGNAAVSIKVVERVLGSRFIQVRNRSTYPPQEKNPKGETHEDIGLFSFDSARKRIVLRQFHVEGSSIST
jgi:hypothetical protein